MMLTLLPNLGLGGGLAPGELPVGKGFFCAPQERRRALFLSLLGTPLVLTTLAATTAADQVRAPTYARQSTRPFPAQSPLGIPQALREVVVAQPPVVGAEPLSAPLRFWQGVDTSFSYTEFLPVPVIPPVVPGWQPAPDGKGRLQVRVESNPPPPLTTLAPDLYAATILTESFSAQRPGPLPLSTTAGMWVGLQEVVVQPASFSIEPQETLDLPRLPSAQPLGRIMLADATPPVGEALRPYPPDRPRPVFDTSRGWLERTALPAAPFVNPPTFQVGWRGWLDDIPQGTAKVLVADSTTPFFVPPTFLVHPKPPVVDTSHSVNLPLATYVPPPIPNMPPYIVVYFWKRVS